METGKQPPYRIQKSDTLGRLLAAARDISAGEVILREIPLAVGPRADSAPVCLACYKPLPVHGPTVRCSRCGVVPVCGPHCERTGGHAENECEALEACRAPRGLMDCGQVVLPLRCLMLRKAPEQESWKWDAIRGMEDHVTQRRGTTSWRSHEALVSKTLQDAGVVGPEDGELVQRICGVLDMNCFEVRAPGNPAQAEALHLRAIYPQAALMAHDCVGNTHLALDDNFTLVVHASVPIPEGATIFFNYTSPLQSTTERREHLKDGRYFECGCARCSDPTELGTHMSSLRCHRCNRDGMVTSNNPLDHTSPWQCGRCGSLYHPGLVRTATAQANDLLENVDRGNTRDLEALLSRLSRSFAPSHASLLELKQNLLAAYRNVPSPGRKVLGRQVELCREILPVVKLLEPGISRFTGIALYELHGPLAQLATKHFQGGDVDSDGLLAQLGEAEAALREALTHLVYEPHSSPEGTLARAAMRELRALRDSMKEVEHAQHQATALVAARARPRNTRRRRK